MESKIYVICNTEKKLIIFTTNKENVKCNNKGRLNTYYEKKYKISDQQKIYYEKNRDKLSQKQNDRYIHFKELLRKYVELENRLKALEKNLIHNKQKIE